MRPEPSLRQLRHFLSLAEHCHFSRAASACLLTQSSLSASIRELENTLQVTLFERTKRSVVLTAQGRDMVGLARDVMERVDAVMEAAKGAARPLSGEIRLGVIPTIGPFLLPRALPGLRAAYPDLRLYLREEQTASLLGQLASGALDLVLLALPYDTEKLTVLPLADDPLLAAFPRGDKLSEYETMTPARLPADRLLTLEAGNCLTDQTLSLAHRDDTAGSHNAGGQTAGRFQASSLHTLVQMVANGLGLTVLPKMAVDAGILGGLGLDIRPFASPKAARRIALAWRQSSHRGEEFGLLGQHLRDELATPIAMAVQATDRAGK
jgi:LysR family hydrogen peroxide-inducible transcriptional activator